MIATLKRREFITLLGSGTAAWPLMVRAQQAGGMRRVGVLMAYPESDPEGQALVAAFRESRWTCSRRLRRALVGSHSYSTHRRLLAEAHISLGRSRLLVPPLGWK